MTERRRQFTSFRAALRQLVDEVGGPDQMSKAMWPRRDPEKGAQVINDWLNPKRREKPDIEDFERMLFVGRVRNCHVAINDLCDRLHYSRPRPVEIKDQLDTMAQAIKEHREKLEALIDDYKRLKAEHELTHVPRWEP